MGRRGDVQLDVELPMGVANRVTMLPEAEPRFAPELLAVPGARLWFELTGSLASPDLRDLRLFWEPQPQRAIPAGQVPLDEPWVQTWPGDFLRLYELADMELCPNCEGLRERCLERDPRRRDNTVSLTCAHTDSARALVTLDPQPWAQTATRKARHTIAGAVHRQIWNTTGEILLNVVLARVGPRVSVFTTTAATPDDVRETNAEVESWPHQEVWCCTEGLEHRGEKLRCYHLELLPYLAGDLVASMRADLATGRATLGVEIDTQGITWLRLTTPQSRSCGNLQLSVRIAPEDRDAQDGSVFAASTALAWDPDVTDPQSMLREDNGQARPVDQQGRVAPCEWCTPHDCTEAEIATDMIAVARKRGYLKEPAHRGSSGQDIVLVSELAATQR